jgi:hypothetical protein
MDHREMARIAGDPVAVRSTAGFVKAALGDRLSEREREFIAQLETFDGPDKLSMRQREWLHGLRSRATRRSVVKGYRASTLVRKLWELRFDLGEESQEFLDDLNGQLKEHGVNLALSAGQWLYLFSLCHEVGEIERYVAFE